MTMTTSTTTESTVSSTATPGDLTAPPVLSGEDEDGDDVQIDGGISITNSNDGSLAVSSAEPGDDDIGVGQFDGRLDDGIAITDGNDWVSLGTTC